jgi:hypothetical protein
MQRMKYFGIAVAALMMTISASASTLTVNCSAEGGNGANTISTTALTCAQITNAQLAGNTLESVTIVLEDSFSQGNTGTNVFDFNYSNIDPDVQLALGTSPNTCVTSGTGSSTTCEDIITGTIIGGNEYQLGNVIASDLAAYVGSGVITVADVSANPDGSAPGSSLTGSGQLGSTAFVTYTFTNGTPEPGSMILLGAGLLAVGAIGRKKLIRK